MCPRLNNRSFPRMRHRRKLLSCNINRIILNQISQFSEAELQESVLSALKGSSASKGRENESDIEKSKREKCTFISAQEYDAAHFANWLRRPQFCSISAATRPSLWEIFSWSPVLQGCFVIYDVEGWVPIWDSSHCRTGDLRVQWHHWLLSDAEEKWTQFVFHSFPSLKPGLSMGLDLSLCPWAAASGFAYGHTQANLDEPKSINNIRRLMGNPYCISIDEKCRDIVMTPETTLALGAVRLHPSRFDKFVSLPVRSEEAKPWTSRVQPNPIQSENKC